MIQLLTKNYGIAILVSVLIFSTSFVLLQNFESKQLIYGLVLFLQGFTLNYLCFRYSVLGYKSSLPLVLFACLSLIILPQLSVQDLIYGFVWLAAFFLAFESRDDAKTSKDFIIYFGILLGVAQTIDNTSVLFMLPVYLLFMQTGGRSKGSYLLSILYFVMIVAAYSGILFVMEIPDKIYNLIPNLKFDYSVFNSLFLKLLMPTVFVSLVVHFLLINNYRFRYPNKSKILNYTMFLQVLVAFILLLLSAKTEFLIYLLMPSSILLSFMFLYKSKNTFANAAFICLLTVAFGSLLMYKILML